MSDLTVTEKTEELENVGTFFRQQADPSARTAWSAKASKSGVSHSWPWGGSCVITDPPESVVTVAVTRPSKSLTSV